MTNLSTHPARVDDTDQESRAAFALAARAVLASKFNRPTLRVTEVRLRPAVHVSFAEEVHPAALTANQKLLEETVMVELAGIAAQQIKYPTTPSTTTTDTAERYLTSAAHNEDEAQCIDAYTEVLLARARGMLRRHWAEVEVVTLALLEWGRLDDVELLHRMRCVQGIRSATLN